MIGGYSAFGHMIIHFILLLLHYVAFRAGKIVAGSITGLAGAGSLLECSWSTSLLGITRKAVTDIFRHFIEFLAWMERVALHIDTMASGSIFSCCL